MVHIYYVVVCLSRGRADARRGRGSRRAASLRSQERKGGEQGRKGEPCVSTVYPSCVSHLAIRTAHSNPTHTRAARLSHHSPSHPISQSFSVFRRDLSTEVRVKKTETPGRSKQLTTTSQHRRLAVTSVAWIDAICACRGDVRSATLCTHFFILSSLNKTCWLTTGSCFMSCSLCVGCDALARDRARRVCGAGALLPNAFQGSAKRVIVARAGLAHQPEHDRLGLGLGHRVGDNCQQRLVVDPELRVGLGCPGGRLSKGGISSGR